MRNTNCLKFITYFLLILTGTSCARQKKISLDFNGISAVDSSRQEHYSVTINFYEATTSTISYSNQKAMKYAKTWASKNNNSCGIYNNNPAANLSDCAHFIAHCLNDGGIKIKANVPDLKICRDGLCYRVQELTVALARLAQSYSNVKEITIDEAIVGDYGFFKIPTIRPTHAFMICAPAASTDDITIYAHTTNRDCAKPEPKWYQFFDKAYRITDAN